MCEPIGTLLEKLGFVGDRNKEWPLANRMWELLSFDPKQNAPVKMEATYILLTAILGLSTYSAEKDSPPARGLPKVTNTGELRMSANEARKVQVYFLPLYHNYAVASERGSSGKKGMSRMNGEARFIPEIDNVSRIMAERSRSQTPQVRTRL